MIYALLQQRLDRNKVNKMFLKTFIIKKLHVSLLR